MTRKSSGPHHVVRARREVDAHGLRGQPDREHANRLDREGQRADPEQQPRVPAVGVDALVDGAQGLLEPRAAQDRHRPRERPPHRRENSTTPSTTVATTKPSSTHRYAPTVVAPDREHEADRREQQRRRPAERSLEQHRPRDRPAVAGVAASRLEDPHRISADRGRQHLAGRVRGEVGAGQPGEAVVDPAAGEQLLPAPGHRPDRDDHDRDAREEVRELGVARMSSVLPTSIFQTM
jgi:hypothetical protein